MLEHQLRPVGRGSLWRQMFSAGWSAMGFIDDVERGVLDRLLVAPVWRRGSGRR